MRFSLWLAAGLGRYGDLIVHAAPFERMSFAETIAQSPHRAPLRALSQQVGKLGDVHRNAPRFVLGHELGRRAPAGLFLVIDIGQRLPVGVIDDETGWAFLDGPGRREAAWRHYG